MDNFYRELQDVAQWPGLSRWQRFYLWTLLRLFAPASESPVRTGLMWLLPAFPLPGLMGSAPWLVCIPALLVFAWCVVRAGMNLIEAVRREAE
jgi:hypothetical protein